VHLTLHIEKKVDEHGNLAFYIENSCIMTKKSEEDNTVTEIAESI
jgi:hypothetical protein